MAEDKKDAPYEAEWTANLRHRPDPNRVGSLQTVAPGHLEPQPMAEVLPPTTETAHVRPEPATPTARAHDPQARDGEPSYYDVPMLKQPVWKWEIALYFYLGGISAGAYMLGRMADRFGGKQHRDLARIASYVAMGALVPSPPLLIADLGDPKRFHHMLRVWKPTSPMNLGTWSIVGYSGMVCYEIVRQYLAQRDRQLPRSERSKLLKLMNNGVLLMLHDAAGVPFSLMVAGYTGVLLSCTANPLWCKNPWLGPLFSSSAISTGAEAVSLALDLADKSGGKNCASQEVLQNIDTAAHVAEFACMEGFKRHAGEKAKPIRQGKMAMHHRIATGTMIAAEVLKRLPVSRKHRKPIRMAAAALGLVSGLATRWAMVFGGHEAAKDPHLSRLASRPKQVKAMEAEKS